MAHFTWAWAAAFVCVIVGLQEAAVAGARICENPHTSELLATRNNSCAAGWTRARIAGANLFDIWWLTSSGMPTAQMPADNSLPILTNRYDYGPADALAELQSARQNGIRVARFFASLYQPHMSAWIQNSTQYWTEFDAMLKSVPDGLYLIPSIGYTAMTDSVNLALGTNETVNDLVRNESSVTRTYLVKYFSDFVQRYHGDRTILFWELGNELNLLVNLPPPFCGPMQCFSTSEMVAFTRTLVNIILKKDPTGRPISSGFSVPRPSAWHQEHCPSKGSCAQDPGASYWSIDSREQWLSMLSWQQSNVDIWSLHLYPSKPGHKECWFQNRSTGGCSNLLTVLDAAAGAAAQHDAMLFIGEYGSSGPTFTGPSPKEQEFPKGVLQRQVANVGGKGTMDVSAIWAWECPTHRRDMVCIWPGSNRTNESGSDRMVAAIASANKQMERGS